MQHPKDMPAFGALVAELARINCALWHEEDKARGDDDSEVASAKRNIDRFNQARNDTIEKIDDIVVQWASNADRPPAPGGPTHG